MRPVLLHFQKTPPCKSQTLTSETVFYDTMENHDVRFDVVRYIHGIPDSKGAVVERTGGLRQSSSGASSISNLELDSSFLDATQLDNGSPRAPDAGVKSYLATVPRGPGIDAHAKARRACRPSVSCLLD
mmetsp:Transcript_36876/g.78243  ORF Transcript_36876/g.78243 Transcript_36876/m.78243 type:complete len:129 (+) Transcript_36876:229-615(+)